MADGLFTMIFENRSSDRHRCGTLLTLIWRYIRLRISRFLVGQYFARIGKKLKNQAFRRMTTGATPGNLVFDIYYGTGGAANGTLLASSLSTTALVASKTNLSWMLETTVHCRSIGATGLCFAPGMQLMNVGLVLSNCSANLIPDSAAVVSGACDLTAANIISVQAKRSGFDG